MFISSNGVVKLGDLGLASQLEHSFSIRDTRCGTSCYMAPEMYDRKGCLGSDVWSLGISIIEMAEGKNPFAGSASLQVMKAVCNGEPPSLTSPEWSSDLVAFVSQCLVKDVDKRWSVNELMRVRVASSSDK